MTSAFAARTTWPSRSKVTSRRVPESAVFRRAGAGRTAATGAAGRTGAVRGAALTAATRRLRFRVRRALRLGDTFLRLGRAELDPLRDAEHALVDLGHDPLAFHLGELLPLPFGHELPDDVAPHRTDVDQDAVAWRGVRIERGLGARREPAIGGRRRVRSGNGAGRRRRRRVAESAAALSVVALRRTAAPATTLPEAERAPGAAAAGARRAIDSWRGRDRARGRRWCGQAAVPAAVCPGAAAGRGSVSTRRTTAIAVATAPAEPARPGPAASRGGRRPRSSMLSSSIAISPSACATCTSCVGGGATASGRLCCRLGLGQRGGSGAGCGVRFGARFGDVHQPHDPLAQLRRHDLHPLAELAREQLGLAPGRFPHRPGVARVRDQRHGRQRHDRQAEERDDEAKAKTHSD